ncbi:MAG: PP2C family protein-serine/threonine phosphatase [Ardenticatenaceae bacterium]
MDARVFEHVRESLLVKRENLVKWLHLTPLRKKRVRLGPLNEQAVYTHLDVLDTALEKAATKTLGRCVVCHGYVAPDHLEVDYTACVCIDHFSAEERRSLEHELELSQVVQRALLPQEVPAIPGLEVAAFSRPAQIVGGDYFDFLRFRDGQHGLVIADVAGHGMSTSLLMASVQTALRTLAPTSDSPADVVRQLNRLFCHNIHFTTFVTLFLASFDPATRTLTYCNAGHNPPLLFRQAKGGNSISWLRGTGAAIGLVETSPFMVETITLAVGDILLLYTDGITEALNPQVEEFGREGLAALVRQQSSLSAKSLVQALRSTEQDRGRG